MISEYLRSVVRCPVCQAGGNGGAPPLESNGDSLRCPKCGRDYSARADRGYLDLRPPSDTFDNLTEYADEEFHSRAGAIRPLFLSARIKMDMMRKLLAPSPRERVLDIGCGKGQFLYYNRAACGELVGIDAGAHFAPESLETIDLTRGDVRLLPFEDHSFDKAYSLDVLEHLDEEGVVAMLAEARRVLKPGGKLFLYSHVMMSSKLAVFQRGVNRLVRWLDSKSLLNNGPERERKSDHRNVLRSYDQLDDVLAQTGFKISDIRYYNVFFKALFEDLMVPLVEHNFYGSKTARAAGDADAPTANHSHDHDHDHHHESARPDVGRWAHAPLAVASYVMKLDVALFGRVRTGPFFLLLEAI